MIKGLVLYPHVTQSFDPLAANKFLMKFEQCSIILSSFCPCQVSPLVTPWSPIGRFVNFHVSF